MNTIETIEQMVEAMEKFRYHLANNYEINAAIQAGRALLEELKGQEPVAWQVHPFDYGIGHEGVYARTDRLEQIEAWKRKGWNVQPLYTHPQPAQPKAEQCTWTQSEDPHIPDTWEANCGAIWTFTEGGPKDNGMKFCPNCGKPTIEAAHGIK